MLGFKLSFKTQNENCEGSPPCMQVLVHWQGKSKLKVGRRMRSFASLIACLVALASLAFAAEVAKIATSSIIASAGSVNLYSGNADIAASGESSEVLIV